MPKLLISVGVAIAGIVALGINPMIGAFLIFIVFMRWLSGENRHQRRDGRTAFQNAQRQRSPGGAVFSALGRRMPSPSMRDMRSEPKRSSGPQGLIVILIIIVVAVVFFSEDAMRETPRTTSATSAPQATRAAPTERIRPTQPPADLRLDDVWRRIPGVRSVAQTFVAGETVYAEFCVDDGLVTEDFAEVLYVAATTRLDESAVSFGVIIGDSEQAADFRRTTSSPEWRVSTVTTTPCQR